MATHIDGRPTGPTAEDIAQRRNQMAAQAIRQRGHRPNRLDAKLELELANRYRRARMNPDERDIEDAVISRPAKGIAQLQNASETFTPSGCACVTISGTDAQSDPAHTACGLRGSLQRFGEFF